MDLIEFESTKSFPNFNPSNPHPSLRSTFLSLISPSLLLPTNRNPPLFSKKALGEKSQSLHSPSRTIIQFSVDSTLPSHIYLQEDALELWSVLLKRSSTLTNDLLELVPKVLMGLIGDATDLLPKLLNIFESYLLLDSQRVLEVTFISLLFFEREWS